MAAWVDCITSAARFTTWIADMGAWTGTWPMQYPTVYDGLDQANGDEIDFVIGVDNPAHPGDAFYMLDGSYPSPFWDAFRAGADPTATSWYVSAVGGATAPAAGDEPSAGAHLWVVVFHYDPITDALLEPPNAPEHYVPASYATGGLAPEPTGHWSGLQDGVTETVEMVSEGSNSWVDHGFSDIQSAAEDTTIGGLIANCYPNVMAAAVWGTPSGGGNGGGGGVLIVDGSKSLIGATVNSTASLTLNQTAVALTAPPNNPPPVSGTLGIDYDAPPFSADYWQFESETPDSYTYGDLRFEAGGALPFATGLSSDPGSVLDIFIAGALPAAGDGPTSDAGLTRVVHMEIVVDDPIWDAAFGINRSVAMDTFGLGLSFTLVGGDTSSFTTAPGAADVPHPPPNGGYEFVNSFEFGNDAGEFLPITRTTSQWRYWIPIGGPVLKTIGENFRSVGGAQIKSLIPGVGWVPVQRHG